VASSFFLCKVCGKEIPEHDVKFSSDGKTVLTPDGVPEDIFCSNCEIAHIKIATGKKSKKKQSSKKGRLDYGKMKVAELKEILKSKKLPVSGPKWQLIERLTDKNWEKEEKAEKRRKRQQSYITQTSENVEILIVSLVSSLLVFVLFFTILVVLSVFGGTYSHAELGHFAVLSFGGTIGILIAFGIMALVMMSEGFAYILTGLVLLFGFMFFLEIVEIEGIGFGVQTSGICVSLLTILIVLYAMNENESMIEAAGHAWLMLTVLGAIFAIILYLVIF
jgi:hypothetical protein